MNILLLMVNSLKSEYPPIGLYNIMDFYKKHYPNRNVQFDVKVLSEFNGMEIMSLLKSKKYNVVGFGCYIWNLSNILSLCKLIKKRYKDLIIILGGPSITYDEDNQIELLDKDFVDYLVIGEGELTMMELINKIFFKEDIKSSNMTIEGTVYKNNNNEIIKNVRTKKNIVNLNEILSPFILHDELRDYYEKYGVVYLEASRGCPYKCSYCAGSNPFFVSKDDNYIIEELEILVNKGYKNFYFLDGTLNYNIERTKSIFRKIIDKGMDINIGFELKIELIDDELLDLMKKVGVNNVEIGLQTSNTKTLRLINRYHQEDLFNRNIKKLVSKGISSVVDLIIGLPGETLLDYLNSLNYCYDIGDINITSNLLKLLPNTQLYMEKDLYGYKFNKDNLNKIILSNSITKEELIFSERTILVLRRFWSMETTGFKKFVRTLVNEKFQGNFGKFIMILTIHIYSSNHVSKMLNMTSKEKMSYLATENLSNYSFMFGLEKNKTDKLCN